MFLGSQARAARRIVFLGFSGPRGAEVTRMVGRFLTGHFELVGAGRFASEARRRGLNPSTANGRSVGARAVNAVAVVSGQVARSGSHFVLRVSVFGAGDGLAVASLSFPLRGMRADPLTARRVATALVPAVARARPGAPIGAVAAAPRAPRPSKPAPRGAPRPPPRQASRSTYQAPRPVRDRPGFDDGTEVEPGVRGDDGAAGSGDPGRQMTGNTVARPPLRTPGPAPRSPAVPASGRGSNGEGDSLGFDVGDDEGRATRSDPGKARSTGRSSSNAGELSGQLHKRGSREEWEKIVEASVGVILLSRRFDFNDAIQPPQTRNYRASFVPAIVADVALYPLAFFGHNALAGLGLVGNYYRVPVLSSTVEDAKINTTLQEWELGLSYRWNMLGRITSPTLRAGISVGQLGFEIHYDPAIYSSEIPLPNIVYLYLKFAIARIDVPFYTSRKFSFGGLVSFDYLYVFNAGAIERTDTGGYGASQTGGIDASGGFYATTRGFFFRATYFYRRMFFAFDGSCAPLGCNTAGGALDIYHGLTLLGGYAY